MIKILERLLEYLKDKKLAEKCGLPAKEICIHTAEFVITHPDGLCRCMKCGKYYSQD